MVTLFWKGSGCYMCIKNEHWFNVCACVTELSWTSDIIKHIIIDYHKQRSCMIFFFQRKVQKGCQQNVPILCVLTQNAEWHLEECHIIFTSQKCCVKGLNILVVNISKLKECKNWCFLQLGTRIRTTVSNIKLDICLAFYLPKHSRTLKSQTWTLIFYLCLLLFYLLGLLHQHSL